MNINQSSWSSLPSRALTHGFLPSTSLQRAELDLLRSRIYCPASSTQGSYLGRCHRASCSVCPRRTAAEEAARHRLWALPILTMWMGAPVEESLVWCSAWRLSKPGFEVVSGSLLLTLFTSSGSFLNLFGAEAHQLLPGGGMLWERSTPEDNPPFSSTWQSTGISD